MRCGPVVSVAGSLRVQQAIIGPVSRSSRPALLIANVFLSSRKTACSSAVGYLLIAIFGPQVRPRRRSDIDGDVQRCSDMPQPASGREGRRVEDHRVGVALVVEVDPDVRGDVVLARRPRRRRVIVGVAAVVRPRGGRSLGERADAELAEVAPAAAAVERDVGPDLELVVAQRRRVAVVHLRRRDEDVGVLGALGDVRLAMRAEAEPGIAGQGVLQPGRACRRRAGSGRGRRTPPGPRSRRSSCRSRRRRRGSSPTRRARRRARRRSGRPRCRPAPPGAPVSSADSRSRGRFEPVRISTRPGPGTSAPVASDL